MNTANEIKILLYSFSPSKELTVREGSLQKRSLFSSIAYCFGYRRKEEDAILKNKLNAILDQLCSSAVEKDQNDLWLELKKVIPNENVIHLFLTKLGNLTPNQIDKSKLNPAFSDLKKPLISQSSFARDFGLEFHLHRKKMIKRALSDFRSKIEKEENAFQIKQQYIKLYNGIIHDVDITPGKDKELDGFLKEIKNKKSYLETAEEISCDQLRTIVGYDLMEAKTLCKIAKMHLLFKIGAVSSSEKGANGTILVRDLRKRALGVFKPDDFLAKTVTKIVNIIKSLFGQLSLLSGGNYARPKAEYIAYRIDRHFGIGSVPASQLTKLDKAKGVFQLAAATAKKTQVQNKEKSETIAKRLKEAKDVAEILNKEEFSTSELEIFQRFVLLDFLIGNLDAHEENWFIDSNEKEVTGIIGIDKANSWLKKNPNSWDYRARNQYKWKSMNIAKQPFTESTKKIMKSFTKEKMEAFFTEIEKEFPEFFNEKMKRLALERAAVIRKMASTDKSPRDLAKIICDADFNKELNSK